MEINSSKLSEHLKATLSLSDDAEWIDTADDEGLPMTDVMITEYATQHDLPLFISIDGSVSKEDIDTVSISIVASDIKDNDINLEWQHRPVKILLIRSWRLPRHWGTGSTCINMAETLGIIIGEYTIPSDMPVIYITDSNNARTLHRNLKQGEAFTHRQRIRHIKQGIDCSIANHLEHLTKKWPRTEQLSVHAREQYQRGAAICKIWASQHSLSKAAIPDDRSLHSSMSWDDDDASSVDSESNKSTSKDAPTTKNRYRFDASMYDLLDRSITIKVFSHQLNPDFSVKTPGKHPQPNLYVTSANQVADNAATQARKITATFENNIDHIYYPPFSQRWCFSFEGSLTNKGVAPRAGRDVCTATLH